MDIARWPCPVPLRTLLKSPRPCVVSHKWNLVPLMSPTCSNILRACRLALVCTAFSEQLTSCVVQVSRKEMQATLALRFGGEGILKMKVRVCLGTRRLPPLKAAITLCQLLRGREQVRVCHLLRCRKQFCVCHLLRGREQSRICHLLRCRKQSRICQLCSCLTVLPLSGSVLE